VTFLSPLFLLGALAAAIPVLLHLLKREPEPRVRFAAVRLLKHAPVEYTERRRIRELLLLALRVAALVLLALAFARPFLASGAAPGSAGVTIVALDTSYSMSAPGAFAHAKQLARAAVDRVPSGDLVGVVTFSDLPAAGTPAIVCRCRSRHESRLPTSGRRRRTWRSPPFERLATGLSRRFGIAAIGRGARARA
jgi:hypothetical protein